MPESNDVFYVWTSFRRIKENGSIVPRSVRERLAVSDLRIHYRNHSPKKYGTFFFSDGTKTDEFLIDRNNPTEIAQIAMNYERWYYANNRY